MIKIGEGYQYIKENFGYGINYPSNCNVEHIIDLMGNKALSKKDLYWLEVYPDARWAYWIGKLYFKSEEDLIEFKLRFL